MRTYQVDLQFADLIAGDAYIAEFADTGRDGVGHLIVGDKRVDDGTCSVHPLARIGSQQHGSALRSHLAYFFER